MNFVQRITDFLRKAYLELKQVSWLSRPEMIASTTVVIMLVTAMAIFISIVDFILSKFMRVFI